MLFIPVQSSAGEIGKTNLHFDRCQIVVGARNITALYPWIGHPSIKIHMAGSDLANIVDVVEFFKKKRRRRKTFLINGQVRKNF